MSAEVGSVKPNPYIFDIENRRKRKPRLAHDLGAGAKCNKCGDKCPGFELHFWRKICMNCRCGKDDHDVQDDDEDIGKVVIGKLFERPARTKKEELEFSYGNDLEMVNEETGKPEKVKFDWVPPNTERNLAARYMALLPPEKRPVAGSEAAKERRKQLEQQVPLYDMDASQRCENMPAEELQSFEAYMERIRTQVAGQGIVQEIAGMPMASVAEPLRSQHKKAPQLSSSAGNVLGQNYIASPLKNEGEGDNTYAVPYKQVIDQPYRQAIPHGDIASGFKEFMGGMIGESGGFVASSNPYGVAPGISQPLRSLGEDQGVEGITEQLSGLQTNTNQQGLPSAGGSHQHTRPGTAQLPPPSFTPERDQTSSLPTSASSKQDVIPSQEGLISNRPEQPPTKERFVPVKQGLSPYKEGFVPVKQGLLPAQKGVVPGKQELPPGQEGFIPDRQVPLPGQERLISGKRDPQPGQGSFVSGKQGNLPNFGSPMQKTPVITSGDQSLTPSRDNMIYRYQMGGSEPTNIRPYEGVGVLETNKPERFTGSNPSMEGSKDNLPQMQSMEGRIITNKEAIQAPYDAYKETLAGSMQVAPGSDVTVLFPGESRVLGSRGMSEEVSGQKSKFSCQYCSLPMNVGDVAIFCERAGADKCWHPACFSCFTCKELLADLIYFYKDGKVFCGRHFTEAADIPRCKACDELIFGNSWTRADDFNWHIHHYCCYVCDTPLAGQRYVPDKEGFPYCLPCHMAYQAKMCQTCEEKIAPEENRCSHRGYHFHASPHCFQCYSCKLPLLGKKFKMSKNWLFCSNECVQAAAADIANNPNPKEMPQ